MNFICLIPARYASTRFPGKPLAKLGGKLVIQHVYERAQACFETVYVCTDDERISKAVADFGGKSVMTSSTHRSGTERCNEAYSKLGINADVIVNIQGDEPFIHPSQLEALKNCFTDSSIEIATLVKPFSETDGLQALQNPNTPKVVFDENMNALYFSRSVVPYLRGVDPSLWLSTHQYYKHIGIYGYRADILGKITKLPPGQLEVAESLEQLRWLENGFTIRVAKTMIETVGIDTPDDLKRAELYLKTLKV